MKTIKILCLFVLVLGVTTVQSQTKKEVMKQNEELRLQIGEYESVMDSLDKVGEEINLFLSHIQSNYIKSEKDTSIQSIQTALDSVILAGSSEDVAINDSLKILVDSIAILQAAIGELDVESDLMREIIQGKLKIKDYPQSEKDFLGPWNLANIPIALRNDSIGDGLVSYSRMDIPEPFLKEMITQIEFQVDDLADIYFRDGRREKCFYKINNFTKTGAFSITFDLRKGSNISLIVIALPDGLQFSYKEAEIEDKEIYFIGYMTR